MPPRVGPVPQLGTNATSVERLRNTLADMGEPGGAPRVLRWNVSYMSDADNLNTALLDYAESRGVVYHIVTLEIRYRSPEGQPLLKAIAAGEVDGRLAELAGQMLAWQAVHPASTLIVRPLHEANSTWYPWGFLGNGNAMADFGPAWSRVRSVMRSVFADLPFFWCPNRLYGGQTSYVDWYPGDDQVEFVGADGYNRSQSNGGFSWERPRQVHEATIRAIRAVSPLVPYIVGETATSEPAWGARLLGHSKAEWFGDLGAWMREEAPRYGIVVVCYFDYDKTRENGNDWRVYPAQSAFFEATKDL